MIGQMIRYKTRPGTGGGTWEGDCLAYITDTIDPFGKREIIIERPSGRLQRWYLFDDEWYLLDDEPEVLNGET